MAWIGAIFAKTNIRQNELRKILAIMTDAAFSTRKSSAVVCSQFANMYINDVQRHGLAQLSMPIEIAQPTDMHIEDQGAPALVYAGHFYEIRGTTCQPCQAQRSTNQMISKRVGNFLAGTGTLKHKVKQVLTSLDGDYALAVSDGNVIVASRDSRGTKPLYFAENNEFCALASNRRPLWKIGLNEVRPVRAGTLALLGCGGVNIEKAFSHRREGTEIHDMADAVCAYGQVLYSAVRKRLTEVRDRNKKVGVLLSGGVDSCLLAKLVRDVGSELGIEPIAYTAGLADAPDVAYAQEFAHDLDIKCKTVLLDIDRVEKHIPEVIEAIEESDFVQVETGIGLYAAMDVASQDGISTVFSGQGADELWGGYSWYPKVLAVDGRQTLCRRMRHDFARADIETLDRENKIAMAHGVELFFPYLDAEVVRLAMGVACELKVASGQDCLGKHPHRQLAMRLGISGKYANREKVAIQHGAGIHGLLDAIARRNGFDHALVREVGYRSKHVTKEKLGSSARYGYRYVARDLWHVPENVQFFFHVTAYRKGLLNTPTRDRVQRFADRARPSSSVPI